MGMDVLIVNDAIRPAGWVSERIEHLANYKEVKGNITVIGDNRRWKCKTFTTYWKKYGLERVFEKPQE